MSNEGVTCKSLNANILLIFLIFIQYQVFYDNLLSKLELSLLLEFTIKLFFNKHHIWIAPLFTVLTTLFAALFTYSLPSDFATLHPARFQFFNFFISNAIWFFFISGIILIGDMIFDQMNRKTIEEYSKKIDENKIILDTISENIRELFNGFLYGLARNDTIKCTANERITLYIHNGGNSFIPFGRYSENVQYTSSGRSHYPDNEGCIAEGWIKGWHFENKLPTSNLNTYYKKCEEKYKMPIETTKQLKMKSELFAVLRLTFDTKHIGVLVIESTQKTKYNEKQIKEFLDGQKEYLSKMIHTLEAYIPKPSNANAIEG